MPILADLFDLFSRNWVEILFWLPTLMDVMLLVVIYANCNYHGVTWYLNSVAQQEGDKKNDDVFLDESKLPSTVHLVWELAMMAYSAYAVLLPFAVGWCTVRPELRPTFCWAMTVLMVLKVRFFRSQEKKRQLSLQQGRSCEAVVGSEKQDQEKINSLYYFYFPTYGGYAILKTFIL